MNVERQQVYNNTMDTRGLIREDHMKNASSLGNLINMYHASTESFHTTYTNQGESNIECTDEIIEFNLD